MRTPSLLFVLAALHSASLAGCGEPPMAGPPVGDANVDTASSDEPDVSPDLAPDAAPDAALDATADARPDAAPEAGIDATLDAVDAARPPDAPLDAPLDARPDARPDATADAADAPCAGAVAGGSCSAEGTFCGGPCSDPCAFCNVLRCVGGRWGRLEVPPLPPDMCRDAGVDAADASGLNCDPRTAACDSLPPPCRGGGEVREVRGACWGECVVYDRCRPIACDPAMSGQCPTNTVCFRTTRLCGLPVR